MSQAPPVPSSDPNHRLQDFAVGFWDVFKDGRKYAEVRLEPVLGGCAIHEVWTPVDPAATGHGRGLFSYSKILGAWHYYWAADTGATSYFTSHAAGPGEIVYVTTLATPEGGLRRRHWTLSALPDGGVRELSIATEDDGQTWSVEYDLYWLRK